MASYIEAVRLGVDIIEFDVLTTVDGVVICHHDALIDKTGERRMPCCTHSVRSIRRNWRFLGLRGTSHVRNAWGSYLACIAIRLPHDVVRAVPFGA